MHLFTKRFFTFLALSVFLLISGVSFAQVASTTSDGSNDSTTTRRDYVRGWRRGGSDIQQKITTLSTVSSQSVYMPVLFGVEINNLSPNFGDPRSNGRTHAGEDIMATKGTPIVSPTQAVVLRTGVGTGEGNYVYTANPGGETFVYMHLDAFGEGVVAGTVLEKGSLIGYVGNTGNASGGPAHLHFEIHDSNGVPTDPFPRLTGTFTLEEKNTYLTKILTQTRDSNFLAIFLVNNFRDTFNQMQSSGLLVPSMITQYIASLPVVSTIANQPIKTLPAGDLALGSKGADVVYLQQFLITKNVGPSAVRLSLAGTTGNFGTITESALIEYQLSVGINPANGYYGQTTKAIIETTTKTPSVSTTNPIVIPKTITSLTRSLYQGLTGEDVRTLQKFLNTHGYTVSSSGAGSLGNETLYFGQATKSSVIRFQIANNISPALGYVGPITKASLISLGL